MMTNPTADRPDPLETALRRTLAEHAQVPVPDDLRRSAQRLVSDPQAPLAPASARPRLTGSAWGFVGVVTVLTAALVGMVGLLDPVWPRPDTEAPGAVGDASPSVARPLPTFASPGWGMCAPADERSGLPSPTAGRVRWETQLVHLDAASVELRLGDCTVHAVPPFEVDDNRANIEVVFADQGRRHGLHLNVAADESHWWLDAIAFGAIGSVGGEWTRETLKELTLTPRGESFVGDLELSGTTRDSGTSVPTGLTIRDLRLDAFAPWPGPIGSVPPRLAWSEGCEEARMTSGDRALLLPDGSRLRRAELEAFLPRALEGLLREHGICFVFVHNFDSERSEGGSMGYGGYWCSAPPAGRIVEVRSGRDGVLEIVTFDDRLQPLPTEEPLLGWECEPPATLTVRPAPAGPSVSPS